MQPGAAELCPGTRARWSAGYRAPEQQLRDLGGEEQSILGFVGHLQNRGKEKGSNCSAPSPDSIALFSPGGWHRLSSDLGSRRVSKRGEKSCSSSSAVGDGEEGLLWPARADPKAWQNPGTVEYSLKGWADPWVTPNVPSSLPWSQLPIRD